MVSTLVKIALRLYQPYLQIYVGGKWSEVCDDGFGEREADVACHQLQFLNAAVEGSGAVPNR